jgi:hypothetical protein
VTKKAPKRTAKPSAKAAATAPKPDVAPRAAAVDKAAAKAAKLNTAAAKAVAAAKTAAAAAEKAAKAQFAADEKAALAMARTKHGAGSISGGVSSAVVGNWPCEVAGCDRAANPYKRRADYQSHMLTKHAGCVPLCSPLGEYIADARVERRPFGADGRRPLTQLGLWRMVIYAAAVLIHVFRRRRPPGLVRDACERPGYDEWPVRDTGRAAGAVRRDFGGPCSRRACCATQRARAVGDVQHDVGASVGRVSAPTGAADGRA